MKERYAARYVPISQPTVNRWTVMDMITGRAILICTQGPEDAEHAAKHVANLMNISADEAEKLREEKNGRT